MELIDRFLQFEDKNGLLNKEINGFYYWGYIRCDIYSELESRIKNVSKRKSVIKKENIFSTLDIIRCFIFNSIFKSPMKIKKKCDVLFFNHERRMFLDGVYTPIYFKYIIDRINDDYLLIEPLNVEGKHYKNISYNKRTRYTDDLMLKRNLYKLFNVYKDREKENEIIQIIRKLNEYFNVNINAEITAKRIFKMYIGYIYDVKYFKKLINRIKPKRIVEVVYYNPTHMAMNEVAKSCKIPVYELQHGIMGHYHIAYNFLSKHGLPYLPDKILLFSQYWKNITRFPINKDNIVVTGYPHMEAMVNKYKKNTLTKDMSILFISQNTIGRQLSLLAVGIVNELRKHGNKFKVYYKLHPNECLDWQEALPELYEARKYIEVVDNAGGNIYEYFAKCNIQIGVYSTALLEGLAFGLDTYIYNTKGSEHLEALCEKKYATLVNDTNDFFEKNAIRKKGIKFFWEKNAIDNICNVTGINISLNDKSEKYEK